MENLIGQRGNSLGDLKNIADHADQLIEIIKKIKSKVNEEDNGGS
jgi:hypothetical protein